jgi:hypothetical protein
MNAFPISLSAAALALPTGTQTIEIFNSVTAFGAKQLRHLPMKRLVYGVEHDQSFTLTAQRSIDGGTNWDTFDTRTVAVAANTIGGPFDYLIDTYDDVKLFMQNGGVDQTVWRPELRGIESTRQPGV